VMLANDCYVYYVSAWEENEKILVPKKDHKKQKRRGSNAIRLFDIYQDKVDEV
ncbi:hypothetical protein HAX54_042283, partial [Datura stramonium]|nr:hypothetical protein [Datura stramonium]